MTPRELQIATGCVSGALAENWLEPIEFAMCAYGIDTPLRQAAFLAQVGHESGGLHYTSEMWGPTPQQLRYEGRLDLGNNQSGDGKKFRGHGLIQITGRANHAHARDQLREKFPDMIIPDFEEFPELLAQQEWAALSAGQFWDSRKLNKWADIEDFERITRLVNGGLNGYKQRVALYNAGLGVLT